MDRRRCVVALRGSLLMEDAVRAGTQYLSPRFRQKRGARARIPNGMSAPRCCSAFLLHHCTYATTHAHTHAHTHVHMHAHMHLQSEGVIAGC
mgnify:CR=1 FL=1